MKPGEVIIPRTPDTRRPQQRFIPVENVEQREFQKTLVGTPPRSLGELARSTYINQSYPSGAYVTTPCRIAEAIGVPLDDVILLYNTIGQQQHHFGVNTYLQRIKFFSAQSTSGMFDYFLLFEFEQPGDNGDVFELTKRVTIVSNRERLTEEEMYKVATILINTFLERPRYNKPGWVLVGNQQSNRDSALHEDPNTVKDVEYSMREVMTSYQCCIYLGRHGIMYQCEPFLETIPSGWQFLYPPMNPDNRNNSRFTGDSTEFRKKRNKLREKYTKGE